MRNYKKQVLLPLQTQRRLVAIAVAGAFAGAPASAQTTGAEADGEPVKVVVTGLRAAMQSSVNLKRNADGFVDGIVAEDIGKFPDTNLAESLQRISGVSIDRNRGEGSRVTVRGVGPDLNMVLLNGRQMPTSALDNLNGRSFDFANLASESISQLQVYKSSRADTPPGGIGATINVMTARPFDRPGMQASVGLKGVYDESVNRLSEANKTGDPFTPELSGIYSNSSGMFGVAISGSYQKRNLGQNFAQVGSGWVGPYRGTEATAVERLTPGAAGIQNQPTRADTLYLWPQNTSYTTSGSRRERINGQLTFQFKPNADLLTTLDYTYSQNKIHTRYNDMSVWFNNGPSSGMWTDGPLAAPLVYTTDIADRGPGAGAEDLSNSGGDHAAKSANHSIGVNQQWRVSPALKLTFDAHSSTAESQPDSPLGSNNVIATSTYNRAITSVDFNHDMPVLSVTTLGPSPHIVAGSFFQMGYQKMKINQLQMGGRLSVLERSNLNFGVSATETRNRSMFRSVTQTDWGGTGDKTQDQSLWTPSSLPQYFRKLDGSDHPRLLQEFYTFDMAAMRLAAIRSNGGDAAAVAKFTPTLDNPEWERMTTEKSKSLFLQLNSDWDIFGMPAHTGIGLRYEKTKVRSTTLAAVPQSVQWTAQNDLNLTLAGSAYVEGTGKYSHTLPAIDFDIDPHKDVKVRASYGETIGRPMYDQIIASTTLSTTLTVTGVNGSAGNPGLLPVHSKNLDLSAEWYYSRQSMASIGLFHKRLDNYAGNRIVQGTGDVTTPIGGGYWQQATSAGGGNCSPTNNLCIRNYIFRTFNGRSGVSAASLTPNAFGLIEGTITGIAGDPLVPTRITTPVNERSDTLKGIEVNVQHMFGASGFGVQANYTKVKSGLQFDNLGTSNDQFALVGLSDSANLVGIYENTSWTVRAAYNWRDKFLVTPADIGRSNPRYTDAYGQLDLSIGYNVNKNLSLQFEGINLTDETVRQYGRTESMVLYAGQSGPRYMVAARYKF